MKSTFSATTFLLVCLAISPSSLVGAERTNVKTTGQPAPAMIQNPTSVKPAFSEIAMLRSQVELLRQDLEKEKTAREKLHIEMQHKIDFLVGLMNLDSQKMTKLEARFKNHTHEYSGAPFGFIVKRGFGNIPDDALIPYVAQENVGKGVKPKTDPPLE